ITGSCSTATRARMAEATSETLAAHGPSRERGRDSRTRSCSPCPLSRSSCSSCPDQQRDWKAGQHTPECQAATFVREPDIKALARQHVVEAGSEIVRDREPGASPVIRTKGQVIDPPLGEMKW